MELSALQPRVRAAGLPLEKLAANSRLSEAEKVTELSRQFEAVLLRQILEEGQKTVFRSKFSTDSAANSIYRSLIVNEMAEGVSQAGSLGLGRSLQGQLCRQLSPTEDGPPGDGEPSAAEAGECEP